MGYAAAGQAAGGIGSSVIEALAARDAAKKQATPKPAYSPPSKQEKFFRQGLRDLFAAASGVTGAGVGQLALIMPEIYRQLGYEPTVVDRTEEAAAAQQKVNEIQGRIADLEGQRSRARAGAHTKAREKTLNKLKRQLKLTKSDLADAQGNLTQLQSQPIQITGLTPLAPGATPTNQPGLQQIQNLTEQQAIDALQGRVATDPTLLRKFDEEEGVLREKLRRQLGPGYETSTAGIQALNDFDRKKTESIAGYTRDLAASMSERAYGGAGTLSDLLSAHLNQMVYPSQQTQAAGVNLASTIQSGLGIQALLQHERQLLYTGAGGAGSPNIGAGVAAGGAAAGQLAQGVADWWKNRSTSSSGGSQETWSAKGAPIGATMG